SDDSSDRCRPGILKEVGVKVPDQEPFQKEKGLSRCQKRGNDKRQHELQPDGASLVGATKAAHHQWKHDSTRQPTNQIDANLVEEKVDQSLAASFKLSGGNRPLAAKAPATTREGRQQPDDQPKANRIGNSVVCW